MRSPRQPSPSPFASASRAERAVAWAGSVVADLRLAARVLRRDVGFTAVAVLSLAAGIGLNSAVFSVVNAVFLQTVRGVPRPERLAFVGGRASYPAYRHLAGASRTLAGLTAWDMVGVEVRADDAMRRDVAPAVADDYFAVLGVRPAVGRFFLPGEAAPATAAPVVVLDHRFWQEALGGAPDVLGRTIVVNGVPLTVVGVAPRAFHGPGPERPPFWLPLGLVPTLERQPAAWDGAGARRWRLVARLRDGVSLDAARAELRVRVARAPELFPGGDPGLDGGRESWRGADSPEKRVEFLLVTVVPLVIVGVILWIGCSNVANLLLARAVARRKEIVVRLANGAPRGRLVRQLLTESLALAALGGALGLLVGAWVLRLVWATFPEYGSLAVELDGRVVAYTGMVAVASTLLFGLAPALQATRVDVAPALRGGGVGDTRGGSRLRAFFLVTQLASSAALLVVAATFVRTLVASRFGADAERMDRIVVGQLAAPRSAAGGGAPSAEARRAFWARARAELAATPGVEAVTLLAAGGDARRTVVPDDAAPLEVPVQRVDTAYFRALGYALVAGHAAEPTPVGERAPAQAVVNERAARQLWRATGAAALGRRLALDTTSGATAGATDHAAAAEPLEVVGVVRDGAPEPRVYPALGDDALGDANVLVRATGPAAGAVRTVRGALARLAPERADARVATLRDAALDPLRRMTRVVVSLGALALALAAVGLYGSVAFFTSQRTREIAVRLSLGAARVQVLRLLLAHGARIVGAGTGLGVALAWVAFRFMGGIVFGQWRLDAAALAGVVAVFALTTLAACWLPGRRASRVDPMSALRAE